MRGDIKTVSLIWDYPGAAMPVTTDGAKVRQILQNLINNALKFTKKGTVTVRAHIVEESSRRKGAENSTPASHVSKWLEFKVADTGIGIPSEKHEAIFNKFHQVDSSETRLYGGVGLGLYIVKNFTEMLGGEVAVDSNVGNGTTFTVRLPA